MFASNQPPDVAVNGMQELSETNVISMLADFVALKTIRKS